MASNEGRIRQRAYEIWEQEGRPHGEDLKHWLLAFQEIAASVETDGQSAKKPRSRKATTADTPAKPKGATKAKGGAQSVPTTTPPPKPTKASRSVTRH
ncbi:DUF2934 domain-containing protein [Rhizobium sp. 1399]|jgi:Protein of unknown function (DUF2934)|uniref:DUF2934 domain-containing protein n=1 Tax=Rhizobium sp. 1399 TaxID=2817758 RepID=UPI002860A5D5|nr:DUF2934 domain-containing protein [Rhizobium sp. 1399]MDR6666090.1 hypothetical protein [Rhizobium sp. 1399]